MAKLSILGVETRGVDMRTNALLLGNKKLHAATNMVFEEGVIKTRPGFRYKSLGCSGQFQGSGEFRPRKGLSASPLSDSKSGLAVVTGGEIWFNCKKIGSPISCNGDVNVFQAENYLIFQNINSSTFWWDGDKLTESPGMQETDWDEVETPVQEMEITKPIPLVLECETENATGTVTVTFTVVNSITKTPLKGAIVTIFKNGNRAGKGITGLTGKIVLQASVGAHTYTVTRTDYDAAGSGMQVDGTAVETQWDECVPKLFVVKGNTDVLVELVEKVGGNCDDNCVSVFTNFASSLAVNNGTITLYNNSNCNKTVTGVSVLPGITLTPSPNGTVIPPRSSINLSVNYGINGNLSNTSFKLTVEGCDDVDFVFVEDPNKKFYGLKILLRYKPGEAGSCNNNRHACNAAIFDTFANDVLLGRVNLNNYSDTPGLSGGAREGSFTLTDTQARQIANGSSDKETINFRFECATTDPAFDSAAFNGACHDSLGNLVISSKNDVELYNGCPGTNTVTVNITETP